MQFSAFEPFVLDPHDIDESLLITQKRHVPVTVTPAAIRKRHERLRKSRSFTDQIVNWLDQYYGDYEKELLVRDIVPVLARYPKLVGEILLHVRGEQ